MELFSNNLLQDFDILDIIWFKINKIRKEKEKKKKRKKKKPERHWEQLFDVNGWVQEHWPIRSLQVPWFEHESGHGIIW